jgi:ADP-ribosyl-[dinitrogen reductase] hydrolase
LKQAVNLGNDADTTAAVFGQIAGAYYGIKGIPRSWIDRVFHLEQLIDLANNLLNSKS